MLLKYHRPFVVYLSVWCSKYVKRGVCFDMVLRMECILVTAADSPFNKCLMDYTHNTGKLA